MEKKLRIDCKCEENTFLEKFKNELELLFQSTYKYTTPKSDQSAASDEDKSKSHVTSSSASFQDDSDILESKKVYFSSSTDIRILDKTPVNSKTSFQTKIDLLKPVETKLTPIIEEIDDDDDDDQDNDSLSVSSSQSLLQHTQSIVSIGEKRSRIALQHQIKKNKRQMKKIMKHIETNLNTSSSTIKDEEKFLESLSQNIGTVSLMFKKLKAARSKLEQTTSSTMKLIKGAARPPFDIIEQEIQIQDLIERINETLQSIQDNQIQHIMNYITQLRGEEISWDLPKQSKSTQEKRISENQETSEDPMLPWLQDHVLLLNYLVREPEPEEEDEIITVRDDYFRDYSYWKQSESLTKESYEEIDETSFASVFEMDDLSTPMKRAQYYLKTRNINLFFRFLGAHLVSSVPDNPIEFLIELLEKCCDYRLGLCMAPLLFEFKHIESLYYSLDPMETGEITRDQYFTGLLTLGLHNVAINPQLNEDLMVNRATFITDAHKLLTEQFDSMVKIPVEPTLQMSTRTISRMSHTRSG